MLALSVLFSFFLSFFENIYKMLLQKLYLYIIWINTKPCITPGEGILLLLCLLGSTAVLLGLALSFGLLILYTVGTQICLQLYIYL
jgi:hypothetical protein